MLRGIRYNLIDQKVLKEALDYQAMLTREMSHRVKNSLASVVGLLRVQGRNSVSEDVRMP